MSSVPSTEYGTASLITANRAIAAAWGQLTETGTTILVVLPAGSVVVVGTLSVPTSSLPRTTRDVTSLTVRSTELEFVAASSTPNCIPCGSMRTRVAFSGTRVGGSGFEQLAATAKPT